MKIVASVSSSTFLVEATEYELAQIAGRDYPAQMKPEIRVGREIRVSQLWKILSFARKQKQSIKGLAESLRGVADELDTLNETVSQPIIEVDCSSN